jgi:hypothetical protein
VAVPAPEFVDVKVIEDDELSLYVPEMLPVPLEVDTDVFDDPVVSELPLLALSLPVELEFPLKEHDVKRTELRSNANLFFPFAINWPSFS